MNECHICTYMAPPAMFAQLHLNIVGKAGGGCVCDKEKGKKNQSLHNTKIHYIQNFH